MTQSMTKTCLPSESSFLACQRTHRQGRRRRDVCHSPSTAFFRPGESQKSFLSSVILTIAFFRGSTGAAETWFATRDAIGPRHAP